MAERAEAGQGTQTGQRTQTGQGTEPPKARTGNANRFWAIAAGVAGAIGLFSSVILATGALFIALDAGQGSALFTHLSDVRDGLVGPLKDVFSFSGVIANTKEALVGW